MGTPKRIISDNGSNFASDLFKYFYELFGIQPTFTSTYNPQANGQIERIHGPLKKGLRDICTDKRIDIFRGIDWDICLPMIQAHYNNNKHTATGYSPYEIIHGRPFEFIRPNKDTLPTLTRDLIETKDIKDFMSSMKYYIKIIHDDVKRNQEEYDKKRFTTANRNRIKNPFEIGDPIKIEEAHKKIGNKKKFIQQFSGPYIVTKILPNNTIEIADPETQKTKKVNIKWVKRYYYPTEQPLINIIQIPETKDDFNALLKKLTTNKYRSMQTETITRTPIPLAKLITRISNYYALDSDNLIADLFAGDGRITEQIKYKCNAFEKQNKLITIGKQKVPQTEWYEIDLTNKSQISHIMLTHKHKYTQVISNPPWEYGFWCIWLAYQLIQQRSDCFIIILLPSDFFVATKKKRQLFKYLQINIVKQYMVGRWNYLQDIHKSSARIGTDSIFVISAMPAKHPELKYETEWISETTEEL